MKVKTCAATIKAAGAHEGTDEGVFEAFVATYDVDSVGDRIVPGAFEKSLADWKASGNPLPVIWSHQSDDPDYHIGVVEQAEERPQGLWVKARLDLEEPKARQVYRLLKGRRVTQFSFSYDEIDARPAARDDSGALKDLHQLKLYEVGPTPIGCNQRTSLLDVKSRRPVLRKGHGMTAQELRRALDAAVTAAHGGPNRYVWVRDYTDDWVVFTAESSDSGGLDGGLQRQGYTVSDGVITLTGQPYLVVEHTEYLPAPGTVKDAPAPTGKASGSGRVGSESGPAHDDSTEGALHAALADLTVKLGRVGALLETRGGDAAEQPQATPAPPAVDPAPEATVDEPARPGTASVNTADDLARLALMEAEMAVDTY